ncbi:MAG: radical SAM protein, partial [Smithella sp.]
MKELFYFEWIIFDNCNLNCSYCVTKGEFSHKEMEKISYVPGREIDIAHRIVELSHLTNKVVVNLTGGEPLLAYRIKEVISILKTASNIHVNLISNFSLVDKIADVLSDLDSILVSLHIRHRSPADMENLINSINYAKNKSSLSLCQVDYGLNADDKKILSHVSSKTEMDIRLQPFIPRWNEKGRIEKSRQLSDKTFISSFGKRCSLGYLAFLLGPDGNIYHGLWCNPKSQKIGNMLAPL